MKTNKLMRGDDMRRTSRLRGAANLSGSVHQQLNMYALAAGAAGVGILALIPPAECVLTASAALAGALVLSEPAEAKIVYTATNVVITCTTFFKGGCRGDFSFDLNHDGIPDLALSVDRPVSGPDSEIAVPAKGNGVEEGAKHTYAAALKAGENIGHAKQFNPSYGIMEECGLFGCAGYWYYAQARYLGVVFQIKGKPHYGWMRIKNSGTTLTGFAYETIPGKAIKAGQTQGKDDVKASSGTMNPDDPGPGASMTAPIPGKQPTLGMLALGAQGVPLWRRKEEVETVK
jgi:hypothetical protein